MINSTAAAATIIMQQTFLVTIPAAAASIVLLCSMCTAVLTVAMYVPSVAVYTAAGPE